MEGDFITPDADSHPRDICKALGRYATGVTIVTTKTAGGEPIGLTCNSFSSVSLSPPLVLWSLSLRSPNLPNFLQATHFAVNVLAHDQIALSQRFSQPIANKFEGIDYIFGPHGMPLFADTSAQFECRTEARHYSGDHVIFIGHVLKYRSAERAPLVYFGGRYANVSEQ
ncbi:MAG: putative styrene monooxygenase, StyA2B-like protein [Betaproteobacteria bacterium]|nr:putative styrene monooxygenase, StyA2B-like protein [Betaproteobacteria bacterium]